MIFVVALGALVACGWHSDGGKTLEERYPHDDGMPTPKDTQEPKDVSNEPDDNKPDDSESASDDSESGSDDSESAADDSESGSDDSGGRPQLDCSDGQPVVFFGQWAVELIQHGTFSPLGSPLELTITDHFIVKTDTNGFHWEFCDEKLLVDNNGDFDTFVTVIPDALKKAPKTGISTVTPECNRIPPQTIKWTWGLEDPNVNPLPTEDELEGHWDQDNDGNPGVTLSVESPIAGQRYLARRITFNLFDSSSGEDSWEGILDFQIEESGLGASSAMLKAVVPITQNHMKTSTYRVYRTDATDCASLMSSK